MQSEYYRVRVQAYAGERTRRRVVVWRKDGSGPYILWGSLGIPDDVDAGALEREVMSRLPVPDEAHEPAKRRVEARLRAGLGQA